MRVLVLGCGLQGRAVVHDLAATPDVARVVCADLDLDRVTSALARVRSPKTTAVAVNAADPVALAALMAGDFDVVVDMLPRQFVRPVGEAAIAAGVHLVNTYYDHDLRDLNNAAREAGIAILPEMGLDPGIDLLMAAEATRRFDTVTHLNTYGGGLPAPGADDNVLRYRISWTWEGVLNSYARPARVITAGRVVDVPAERIFDADMGHTIEVAPFGVLEAYPNGDAADYADRFGIAESAVEIGRFALRWPGHSALWRQLADLGFLETEPVPNLGEVTPRRFLVEHLGTRLQYAADQRDVVILRVVAHGTGGPVSGLCLELIDQRDLTTGLFAMNRTVGFAASIAAQMIASGAISARGLLSPITEVPWQPFARELSQRGITVVESHAGTVEIP